ncbi:MAG: chromosome partitioning protein ParA, partial [Rubrivirga sp.]
DGAREMGLAIERLVDRQAGPASANQRTSMSHLNSLALLLADLLEQLQNQSNSSGSGGGGSGSSQGMGEQMQQAAQRQAEMNRRIQQMLNEGAGGERLSPDQGQRLRQMAEQQEALRRQIQRALEGGGAGLHPDDRAGLQRIEEQMREQAAELRNGQLNRRTAPRQQQILEQLLEAERSANQRGREERREAQAGSPQRPPPASEPRTTRPPDRVRADLIRALESGYSPDYQDLIKLYFERLQARVSG